MDDSGSIKHKVILITGASKRIGANAVRFLHKAGATIIIHCHRGIQEANFLKNELCKIRKHSIKIIQGDLSDIHNIINLVHHAVIEIGHLDALINNASVFFPTHIHTATENDWCSIFNVNLKAPFFLIQAVLPYLKKTFGSIINITDIYADRPIENHPIYNASQSGLVSLTRSLAYDLGPEVRVNAISPGAIIWPVNHSLQDTQEEIIFRTPLKRMGTPDDIAKTILFLLIDAPYITGQVINVDGGRTIVP